MFSRKKKYHYFVSGIQKNTPFMTEILLEEKVVTYDDICRMAEVCARRYDVYFDEIVIYNFKLLIPFRY